MKQHPIQLDAESERQCEAIAIKWGLPEQRYISKVIIRCVERVYQQEVNGAVVEEDNKALHGTAPAHGDFR
jgi:hypothetical protein